MDSINQSGTNCSRDAPDSFGNPNNLSTHSWDASLVPFHDIRSNEFAAFEAGFVSPSSQQQLRYEASKFQHMHKGSADEPKVDASGVAWRCRD